MKFISKRKKLLLFALLCLVLSILLIVFNVSSQFKKYQVKKRNEARERDLTAIINGIKSSISNTNNLPTTSNPEEKSFLPTLFFNGDKPTGGVNIHTLENVQGYFDMNLKDPSGSPYFIGTTEDRLIVYTNNYEEYKIPSKNATTRVYFKEISIGEVEAR
jgi:hypothetical protein